MGGFSAHMLQHIVLMNAVAPLIALLLRHRLPSGLWRYWGAATIAQLVLLWGWHAPPVANAALSSHGLHLLMQSSLFAAALWFWSALITLPAARRWEGIAALLVTGKLFCLLGILLTFSPRALYATAHAGAGPMSIDLADQQLAGLMMVVACPLAYVAAGVAFAASWFSWIEAQHRGSGEPGRAKARSGPAADDPMGLGIRTRTKKRNSDLAMR